MAQAPFSLSCGRDGLGTEPGGQGKGTLPNCRFVADNSLRELPDSLDDWLDCEPTVGILDRDSSREKTRGVVLSCGVTWMNGVSFDHLCRVGQFEGRHVEESSGLLYLERKSGDMRSRNLKRKKHPTLHDRSPEI